MAPNVPVKILHIADVHLDRPFVGLSVEIARARRRELREALDRCLGLAADRGVDVVTIGGDLWEDEHVTPDTCRWVANRLRGVGLPVVLVAGNHDPLRPGGPYQRVEWPDNVCVLPAEAGLQKHQIGTLRIWGMSWGAAPLTAEVLDAFSAPDDGVHVLLLHGTVASAAFEDTGHCRFSAAAVRNGGFQLCLAGHLHAGKVRDEIVVYPGSPEPLAWDETGRHTAAIIELAPGAPPRVELIDVNRRRYAEAVVDCDGASSSADIEQALYDAIKQSAADGGRTGLCLRATLRGRIQPDCRVDVEGLAAAGENLALLDLRDETQPAFDLDVLAAQPTALGAFVRDLRDRIDGSNDVERRRPELALDLGLRAMHGDDLADAS
jgi:DNA repair exonuclease SbcCD nuclease subunit